MISSTLPLSNIMVKSIALESVAVTLEWGTAKETKELPNIFMFPISLRPDVGL